MKRLLLLALAALSSVVGASAQTTNLSPSTSNYSSAGGFVTLTAGIDYSLVTPPAALGFKINLPTGWKLAPMIPGDPDLSPGWIGGANMLFSSVPTAGMNVLDFSYSAFPANRVSFVAVVSYPASLTGTQTITASAIYRAPGVGAEDVLLGVSSLTFTAAPDVAPAISTHPVSLIANAGQSVTFSVVGTGNPGVTYQWRKSEVELTGAFGPSHTISNVTSTSGGNYDVVLTSALGQVTSNIATLTVRHIANFSPLSGGQGATVTINGSGFTGATAVRFNGVPAATFNVVSNTQVTAVVPTFATTGQISVTLADASVVTSSPVTSFTVLEGPRLVNMSQLSASTGGESAVVQSFSIQGAAPKPVLIRAVGPGLGAFGVTGFMVDPFLSIYDGSGTQVFSNNDWDSSLASAFSGVGAFLLPAGSKDAAILTTLQPGTYTARVTGVGGTSGVVLIETYETDTAKRIAYMSSRTQVGSGSDSKSTGFVLGGAGTTGNNTVLIRAVGAGLGVPGRLLNPTLSVLNSTSTVLATNDNWGSNTNVAEITTATTAVGAMPLGANDSAVLLSLPAGAYTVQVSGVGNTTGIALTEVFLVDSFLPPALPPALLAPLHAQAIDLNGTLTLAAPFIGKPAPAFQWQKDGVDLASQTAFTLSVPSFTGANAGSYRVVFNPTAGAAAVTSASAAVTVNKASPNLQWSTPLPITFGTPLSAPPVSGATLNATAAVPGTFVYTPPAGTILNAGPGQILSVTFTPDDTASYNTVTTAVSLTVNKATPTVTWSTPSAITYGTPLSATQLNAQSPVAGTFVYTPAAGTVLNAGASQTLSVTFSPTDTDNYNTATRTTTLTVDKATPVVTWNAPADIVYGTALSATQLNAQSAVAGTFAYSPAAGALLNAGASQTLSVTFTPTDTANYNTATASTTINVGKATPTVSWSTPAAITFGTPLSGTQLNASSGGVAGEFVYNPASGAVLPVGAGQALTVTFNPTDTNNYNSATGSTTITVNKATPAIAWIPPTAITYGTALSATQLNANSPVAGTFSYNPAIGAVLNAGANQTLSVTFTPTDGASYNTTTATTTITVNQATPTIGWTVPADIVYPAALGSTQLNATASVAGTFVYAPAAGTVLEPGTALPLAVTFTPDDAVNYTGATGGTTINVSKATATVTLKDLVHTYNGSVKGAGADTAPSVSNVSFTYTDTASPTTAPTNVGSYGVTATIVDPRYQGFASGTITINPADQTINFAGPLARSLDSVTLTLNATATSGLGVTFSLSNPSAGTVATLSGNVVTLVNTGTITVTANQDGGTNYNPAPPISHVLTVTAQSQTLTFAQTQLPNKIFEDAPFSISASSNRNLLVTFTTSNPAVAIVGPGTLAGAVTTATVTIVGAGEATITATQSGNTDTGSADDVPRLLTVAKKPATVTLGSLAQVYNNTPRPATAVTVPAGLNVAFTYTPTGGTASATAPTAAGSYAVTATITGATPPESNYIGSDTKTLVIAKATQTITFANILSPKLVNAGSFSLTATSDATPTLPVTFTSSNPAVASIVGNVVTIHALGTTTITAKQAGDSNYLPAVDAPQTLEVRPVAPVITSHPALAQTAVVGSPFIFGPVTLNALSAPTTFSISGAPADLSVNPTTGIISGTPSGTPGPFNIVLTATNATSSDSKTIVLTLQPPAPVITSAAAVSVVAGNAIDYTVTTTPALANGVTLSTSTLPAWLSFNAATGAFTGTPTVPESITVTVTATNTTGAAVLPLQITVTPNPNAPIYTGTSTPSGSAGAAFSFATNFGTGVGTTTYVLTGPTGMVINATGVISWPTPVPGTHHVMIVATRGGLSTTAMLDVTINPAANAPVVTITGGNVRGATVGTAMTAINMTATSLPTSFTIGTLPAGLTVGGTATAPTIGGTPTTPGTTNVAITATNSAGTGPAAILTITVAPHAQAPIITSAPIVQGRVGDALTYTLTATSGGTATTALTYGSTGSLPPGTSLTSGVVSGSPTAAGSYTAFFAGTNANGIGLALQVTFNIAPPLTVPVVTSNGSAPAQVGQAFSYAITATNSPTSFGATPLPAGLSLNAAGMITGVPSTATTATSPALVALTATNGDGTSNPKTLQIAIAPAPAAPVVTSGATANGRVGVAFTYQINASGTPTSYVATGLPAGLSVAPATGAITGTPTVAGTFAATIAAANTAGLGANAPLTLTIAPALTAPAITSAATAAGQVGVAFTYQIAASPGTISNYALTGTLPTGLALNTVTGAITGSPTVPGSVTVSLTATSDGGTSLPQPLTLQIAPAANVPVITSPGSVTANVGAAFSYQITAAPAATALDAANLPSGLAVNPFTGLITGTPTTVGTTTAGLVGTNADGTGPTRDLIVTVQPAATAPVVTGATSLSAQVGVNFTHQITATNGPTSFEVIGAPAWLTVNSSTGAIAGTPTTPGSLAVFFLAGNSAGASSPRIVTFTIAAAANTPLITSSHTATGTVGAGFPGYTITATNTPTGYLAVGLPPGLTLHPTTGAITGTPTSSGTYPVTVSATNATGLGAPITVIFTIARSVTFGL